MNRILGIGLMSLLGATLSGCGVFKIAKDQCLQQQPYELATSVAPLHGAEGLPAANTKGSLKIPDGPQIQTTGSTWTSHCLDKPPRFVVDAKKSAPMPVKKPEVAPSTEPAGGAP
jgi:uncharacterized lipoprotein